MKKGGLLLTALLSASFLIASCQNKQEEATQQPATEQQEQTQEQEQATQQEQQNTQEEQMQEEQPTGEENTGGEGAGGNEEQVGEQQIGEQGGEGQTGGEENKGGEQGGTNEGGNANGGGENANAGGDVTKGKQLFTANGCTACHQEKADTVGPALAKIAQAYAGKKEDLIKFLKGEGKAIVDPAKFSIMQPNLAKTKSMADGDLSALADYILSVK